MGSKTPQFSKTQLEKLVNEPIASFSTSAGCNDGDGVAGDLRSITVKTSSGKDINLVYKSLNMEDPMQAVFAKKNGTFRTESTFYSVVAPLIEKLVKQRNPDVTEPILPIPNHYGSAHYGMERNDDFVCLEDLRPSGFKMADKFKGLNYLETELVLKKIAEYHAFTYCLLKWEGEKVFENELKEIKGFDEAEVEKFGYITVQTMENTLEMVKKNKPELAQRVRSALGLPKSNPLLNEEWPTAFKTDIKYFPVLIHGDLWVNNILFKYKNGNTAEPIDVKFIDFQIMRRGNIFEELQYFIFTSTTPDIRKKFMPNLLETYYNTFKSALKKLDFPMPANFTKGFFIDNFYDCYLPGFKFLSFALPFQLGTPKNEAIAMLSNFAANNSGANGTEDKQPSSEPTEIPESKAPEEEDFTKGLLMLLKIQTETSPRAIQRFEDVAQEMIDLGII